MITGYLLLLTMGLPVPSTISLTAFFLKSPMRYLHFTRICSLLLLFFDLSIALSRVTLRRPDLFTHLRSKAISRMLRNPIRRPEARIQIFPLTILGEAKHPQIQCVSLQGEFWICSEAKLRIAEKMC